MSDAAIQDLLERVQRLEDIEAIHSAWRAYLFALDSADYESLADVFTEDGVVEMVGLDSYQPGQDRTDFTDRRLGLLRRIEVPLQVPHHVAHKLALRPRVLQPGPAAPGTGALSGR